MMLHTCIHTQMYIVYTGVDELAILYVSTQPGDDEATPQLVPDSEHGGPRGWIRLPLPLDHPINSHGLFP